VAGPPLLVMAYFFITEGQPTWVRIGAPLAAMIGGLGGYANARWWRDKPAYWVVVSTLIAGLGIGAYLLAGILIR
jgi:hypothetical protein